MWLDPADKPQLEETLFYFLLSVRDGSPHVPRPVVIDEPTLRALYADPHPDLCQALRHCLDAFLVELDPDPAMLGPVAVPAEALGVALTALNCLAPAPFSQGGREEQPRDLAGEFTAALVATLPPARGRDAALAYHAVLRGVAGSKNLSRLPPARLSLLHALIERSPLTALWALDAHTPAALDLLAAELLPGWQPDERPGGDVWREPDEWLDATAALLADERLARWVRRQWLCLPETRPTCRNVGLLLEALRRRGDHRDFVLQFYEAYDHFCAETRPGEWGGRVRVWPLLETIDQLLRAPGEGEAAIRVNRWGNEYFCKFRPLVEIVIAENGVPADYALLNLDFVLALRPLLPYVTERARQRISFEQIEFEKEASES